MRPAQAGALAFAMTLMAGPLRAETAAERVIKAWIQSYDAAFNSKDLKRLAAFYHPDVTIFEGGETNNGWVDYRDNHIGPELNEMENLDFSHVEAVPHVFADGRSAYVTSEYRLKARIDGKDVDASGLETLVVVRGQDDAWKIRHSHTSSRRRAVPASLSPPSKWSGSSSST